MRLYEKIFGCDLVVCVLICIQVSNTFAGVYYSPLQQTFAAAQAQCGAIGGSVLMYGTEFIAGLQKCLPVPSIVYVGLPILKNINVCKTGTWNLETPTNERNSDKHLAVCSSFCKDNQYTHIGMTSTSCFCCDQATYDSLTDTVCNVGGCPGNLNDQCGSSAPVVYYKDFTDPQPSACRTKFWLPPSAMTIDGNCDATLYFLCEVGTADVVECSLPVAKETTLQTADVLTSSSETTLKTMLTTPYPTKVNTDGTKVGAADVPTSSSETTLKTTTSYLTAANTDGTTSEETEVSMETTLFFGMTTATGRTISDKTLVSQPTTITGETTSDTTLNSGITTMTEQPTTDQTKISAITTGEDRTMVSRMLTSGITTGKITADVINSGPNISTNDIRVLLTTHTAQQNDRTGTPSALTEQTSRNDIKQTSENTKTSTPTDFMSTRYSRLTNKVMSTMGNNINHINLSTQTSEILTNTVPQTFDSSSSKSQTTDNRRVQISSTAHYSASSETAIQTGRSFGDKVKGIETTQFLVWIAVGVGATLLFMILILTMVFKACYDKVTKDDLARYQRKQHNFHENTFSTDDSSYVFTNMYHFSNGINPFKSKTYAKVHHNNPLYMHQEYY